VRSGDVTDPLREGYVLVVEDETVDARLVHDAEAVDLDVREGRFQRWLALVTGLSSAIAGFEVGYEHYRGSYSGRIMYTPPILSVVLAGAGVAGFFSKRAARGPLRAASVVTLADALTGFYFHVRGIQRKPGGWRLPITNIVMGPPIFAPLLFGISAYLGLVSSYLRRADDSSGAPKPAHQGHWAHAITGDHERISWEQDVREGRFQQNMAAAAAVAAALSGFEAWYSHYKNNFRYWVQWTPIAIAPLLTAAGIAGVFSKRAAHTWLPALSAVAIVDGGIGVFYHTRGIVRRPGGLRKLAYNIVYGPPVSAPMLFSAAGFLGILASLLRRETRKPGAQSDSTSGHGGDVDEDPRPRDPRTGEPIGPLAQPGYYPGYSTLSQRDFWDAATRRVVIDRVENVPPIRFFDEEQARLMEALAARVLPQDDRDEAHRIPIVPQIDKRLYENTHDGYRFADMPPDREAFTIGIRAIDEMARAAFGRAFAECARNEQERILKSLHDGKPLVDDPVWHRMPAHKFFMLLVQDCADAYYAHPWAWDEIGFGGPAYPRAYTRLERGEPEPWEVQERRYEWQAPASSESDVYEAVAGSWEHVASPGRGGTH